MNQSKILITISKMLFPFVILFGIYIIINGDVSVGGGFQGGVILSTSYLLLYFITWSHPFKLSLILKIDKYLFVLLPLVILISVITRGVPYTNFFDLNVELYIRRIYLIILNLLIGLKVAFSFISLFIIFIEEGNS